MPETLRVETARPYDVIVGSGVLEALPDLVRGDAAVVTDSNVAEHVLPLLPLDVPGVVVEAGEASKTLATLDGILEFLADAGFERTSTVVGLGGGVVGDLAGLAASLYMRGIDVVHVPTSLLAMVDSSVGGKTAVNLDAGKNLAGTLHQPRVVVTDVDLLATLPDAELRSGLGEVVKSALIGDPGLLTLVTDRAEAILGRDRAALEEVVRRCVAVKAAVVAGDETEEAAREVLNLGHTFGHAIELVAGYGEVPHGVAVAAGLGLALRASQEAGVLAEPELPAAVERALGALGLPRGLEDLRGQGLDLPPTHLREAMRSDKKRRAGQLRFVLVRAAGRVERGVELEGAALERLLA